MALRGTKARIDLVELEKLAAMQCTDEEIAAWFKVSTRTIERCRRSAQFAEVMEHGKAKGRISMRRAQLRLLEGGNATMAIWLGKQYLGQTDEIGLNGQVPILVVAAPVGANERIAHANDAKLPAAVEFNIIDISPDDLSR